MTLTLDLPDQLAGPVEMQTVRPITGFPAAVPSGAFTDERDDIPSSLARARVTTDRNPESAIAWARLAQSAQAAGVTEEANAAGRRALDLGLAEASAPAVHAAMIVLSAVRDVAPLEKLLVDPKGLELPTEFRFRAAVEVGDTARASALMRIRLAQAACLSAVISS